MPRGVTVVDDRGNLLYDLNTYGQEYKAAVGGAGGSEISNFIGLPGQKRHIRLDLKLLADIGLVGFPNAGKSTLLDAISNAKYVSYVFYLPCARHHNPFWILNRKKCLFLSTFRV